MGKLKVLELFAGIGACSKALERLGIEHEIVDAVEIDKYAIESFNAIHNTNFEPQDITKWDKDIEVDLIMHGSPCQDFSVAGKQAGGDEGTGTRSSLMYETIRIVNKLKPKYVIWENVKNLLSQKHRHNFDNYIEIMSEGGYNSYYQVLNSKDYGIPQNRERIFTISIRKDIDKGYIFPKKEELKLRLKDMLEEEVDEKYYLSDAQIDSIKFSNFTVNQRKIQEKEYSDTLCARDYKDPKCVRVGGIFDTEGSTHQAGSIYDKGGLSPTLDVMQGGWRQPSILEDFYKNRPVREYSEVAPTLRSERMGLKVKEPQIITHNVTQKVKVRLYPVDIEALKTTLRNAKLNVDLNNKEIADVLQIPQTQVEHYFRTDNSFAIPSPEIWLKLKELLKIETNYFDESIMTFEEKDNEYDISNRVYDEEGIAPTQTIQNDTKILTKVIELNKNPKHQQDLVQDADGLCRTIPAGTHASTPHLLKTCIKIKNATKQGYLEAEDGDSVNLAYPKSNTRRGRVGKEVSQTLTANDSMGIVTINTKPKLVGGIGDINFGNQYRQGNRIYDSSCVAMALTASPIGNVGGSSYLYKINNLRIRKLTPLECWRLQGFDDKDFYKAKEKLNNVFYKGKDNSNSQLYKQAGNSITVNVLEKIFKNLFKE